MIPDFILARITAIQKELDDLARAVAPQPANEGETLRLKGIWQGTEVDETDFEDAARSLFKSTGVES
ncbi:MAG: hypothetical protein HY897_16500 [Deltaproteobacteria bacterium]|nr:hypothetical protein [Deltaproteobacteria bacterium]